jgi:hypothetical protein
MDPRLAVTDAANENVKTWIPPDRVGFGVAACKSKMAAGS